MDAATTQDTIAQHARTQRIIYSAAQAFFTRGYAATLVDDIAFEASVSKLTLYRLFGSKLDLAAAVLQSLADRLEVDCGRALELDGPVQEYLERVGIAYLRWFIRPIGKCWVYEQARLVVELSSVNPEYAQKYSKDINDILIPRLSANLKERASRGELLLSGANFIISNLYTVLSGGSNMLFYRQYEPGECMESDIECLVRGRVGLLLHGCAAAPVEPARVGVL